MNLPTPIVHTHTATELGMIVNVHIVETRQGVVVIDGAVARSSSQGVRELIEDDIGKPLLAVLLTHGHPDHYMGVAEIVGQTDTDFYALQGAIDQARDRDAEESAAMSAAFGDNFPQRRTFPNRVVRDGDAVTIDGVNFHVRDYGPCESHSDAVWFIDEHDAPIVFCGDLIYNNMHLFMKDGHALEWLRGLDRLKREFSLEARFYPAHGPSCGREGIYWTQGYIRMYLGMLRALLEGGGVLSPSRQQRLIAAIRSFLPKDDLIELAQFKLDETIAVLSQVVNATDIQESEVT